MTVEVCGHIHDKRRYQPEASIHLEMGEGQSASEESRLIGGREVQGAGPGVQGCNAPLFKKMSYLVGIKYLISFPYWSKFA